MDLNEKPKKIINLLYFNNKMNKTEIGKNLSISRQTITKYMKYIDQNKLITKINIVNIEKIRNFFIEIKTNPEEPRIIDDLRSISATKVIDGIIGRNSLMVKFCIRNDEGFSEVLNEIDKIISGTRFQHYRVIECIHTFKNIGRIIDIAKRENNTVTNTIKLKSDVNTDYSLKFYLQIMPKELIEYKSIAENILASEESIVELFRTGQEFGLLAVVRTNDVQDYRNFIAKLYKTGKIHDTISTFVIQEHLTSIFKPFNI